MKWTISELERAHLFSLSNLNQVQKSTICGCFYCGYVFSPDELSENDWTIDRDGPTVLCPNCMIDSVIGDASGFPVEDEEFLSAMSEYYFDNKTLTITREKTEWIVTEIKGESNEL